MRTLLLAAAILTPLSAAAQPLPATICGLPVATPAQSPPAGGEPMVLAMVLCFGAQGGTPMIEPETYLYYIRFRASEPSRGHWVPYDTAAEQLLLEDFRRLWATNFLDDLKIEAINWSFPNGAPGKLIVLHLEERRRIKLVDYDGATRVSRSDINDRLKERGIDLRLDSFVDEGVLRRVASTIREL